MTTRELQADDFLCPGERSAISRAVHLGRLARFYPACRTCPHRDQTGTLSPRQVKRLLEARLRGVPRSLVDGRRAAGLDLNEPDPRLAKKIAVAFGVHLLRRRAPAAGPPTVVIARDGRPLTAELVAAMAEGLRWMGCGVLDAGSATAACMAFAVDHDRADGGIMLGNPMGMAQSVGVKVWSARARPLSAAELAHVRQLAESEADRPTRRFGPLKRCHAEAPYLERMARHYHALRPLKFVLDTTSPPLLAYLKKLIEPVACELIPCRVRPERLGDQVQSDAAHFAVRSDDDGQRCRLVDECGRRVPGEQFSLLVARFLLSETPGGAVVLEDDTPADVGGEIRRLGGRVVGSDSRPAEMEQAMRQSGAIFGGGPSGRFWYRSPGGHASADALVTLTTLMRLLSRSDRRLSNVLDECPVAR